MRPMHAAFALPLILAATASPGAVVATPETISIGMPKSARGNGCRGHFNNKGLGISADEKKRQRKAKQKAQRRNR
jgi:hypothetical protein